MKQTAVEWFNDEILIHLNFDQRLYLKDIFEQAKELEKQQIIDAYTHERVLLQITAEQYYNETYKNQQTKWYITLANGKKNGLSLKTNHRVKENYQQWKNINIK